MQTNALTYLLQETWKSPIFGDSFHVDASLLSSTVMQDFKALATGFSEDLYGYIRPALADLRDDQVREIVAQIVPKTVSFCPALAAGELDDLPRLQAVSVAIGLMYWADQTMDRGDVTMPLAIRLLGHEAPTIAAETQKLVDPQLTALQGISKEVSVFARPEDTALVLDCFDQQVLMNEVRLDDLSREFQDVNDQAAFLETHAVDIARFMVIDAGFPSVSSSLYAIYRQHDRQLPPLSEVYDTPELAKLLRICNAVVRVADELGDWEIDAGKHPEWGDFRINLFNQAHPALIEAFLTEACVEEAGAVAQLTHAFEHFHDDAAARAKYGDAILDVFFDHARTAVTALPAPIQERHARYITLCKRVLEIGYVNRMGDMVLAQGEAESGQ